MFALIELHILFHSFVFPFMRLCVCHIFALHSKYPIELRNAHQHYHRFICIVECLVLITWVMAITLLAIQHSLNYHKQIRINRRLHDRLDLVANIIMNHHHIYIHHIHQIHQTTMKMMPDMGTINTEPIPIITPIRIIKGVVVALERAHMVAIGIMWIRMMIITIRIINKVDIHSNHKMM